MNGFWPNVENDITALNFAKNCFVSTLLGIGICVYNSVDRELDRRVREVDTMERINSSLSMIDVPTFFPCLWRIEFASTPPRQIYFATDKKFFRTNAFVSTLIPPIMTPSGCSGSSSVFNSIFVSFSTSSPGYVGNSLEMPHTLV